ncbi:MAG: DUF3127 domain-containing protein [Bacteroidota bacterium]|nr:DUF3127 domain-containing protein [Bacteroidota bacterium]
MQLSGKLIQLLPLQTGQGKNGPWKKQEVILETEGQYPKKVCVAIWGDKADEKMLQAGNILKIDFDVESREYNGRWYTDVKAWKVELAGGTSAPAYNDAVPPAAEANDNLGDDLPF